MNQRLNYFEIGQPLAKKLMDLNAELVKATTLERSLIDLINIRVSSLNGCAFCLDMHVKEAKIHGERELRLYHVAIWKESPLFTPKERAALAFAEAVNNIGNDISDELYEETKKHFSEKEIIDLVFGVSTLNTWNRLNVTFKGQPGSLDAMFGLNRANLT
ncbi:MAG: carboxymuconolactone decarboxylase family protein [Bdellovibrio sp.]|nr:carboxymuconolactone decarboxylase family protein [Bdellovibrio sp.]